MSARATKGSCLQRLTPRSERELRHKRMEFAVFFVFDVKGLYHELEFCVSSALLCDKINRDDITKEKLGAKIDLSFNFPSTV